MNDTNPIELVDGLKGVLERYIATTLPISRRYPQLAARFREELSRQPLVVGPYVEALPDFEKGASLTPGAYVGVASVEDDGVDFAQRMKEIHKELLELQAESNRLMETISKNLEEMGV